jgi:hypothetical protein
LTTLCFQGSVYRQIFEVDLSFSSRGCRFVRSPSWALPAGRKPDRFRSSRASNRARSGTPSVTDGAEACPEAVRVAEQRGASSLRSSRSVGLLPVASPRQQPPFSQRGLDDASVGGLPGPVDPLEFVELLEQQRPGFLEHPGFDPFLEAVVHRRFRSEPPGERGPLDKQCQWKLVTCLWGGEP